ncbi:UvrD-helicase domain-containing protein [Luteolibacter marinus]|uniref:UvrD-helicase domain-containing protein n=1 Tax=Luteolibacter marinus TaxID=2776705 RepID=UPI0031BB1E8C
MSEPGILSKNLMILASAGSGKTFQLGNRVIGLIGAREVDPARIVALTFTRKAAGEFADSVLSKLASCAADPAAAAALCRQVGATFEVPPVLWRVVRALPAFQLGTMDGFFAKIVRGFQYELGLTGGTFELIEGPRLEAAMADILTEILGTALEHGGAEEFLQAFRRATLGKEGQGVLRDVEQFLGQWHGWWKSGIPLESWGAEAVFGGLPEVDAWEEGKRGLLNTLRQGELPDPAAKLVDQFELHTVGSGRIAKVGVLFDRLLEAVPGEGEIEVKFRNKPHRFSARTSDLWREVFRLLAGCELAAAVARTRAVAELVAGLDGECERRLRRKGLLGFDDVKQLMGRWTRDEESRLRREAVDFRLDARYDHWLLDEFQDTSRAEWNGIVPLLDEAASREDGSLFVVGDRKQAIYGWRGGDVSLFDEVERRYGANDHLKLRTMPESWRSCPAVLELVNAVCGDVATIRELFGAEMARRWPWEDHVSAKPQLTGESRVEVVAKDDRDERLVELLREIGIGGRNLTCGVLVRTNAQVRATASLLREHGFDVIEEGRRQPVADNAPGVALLHLVRWLADPADAFARQVVAMSPLQPVLESIYGTAWYEVWEGSLKDAIEHGFATAVEQWIEPLWDELSTFAQRRVGDVIGALAEFDAAGAGTPREAARWLADLEIPQSPGAAAVQVLTVHKSKGLGFDVVVLPEIEDTQVPNHGDFNVARGRVNGEPWLLEPPPAWVRSLVPVIGEAENAWADDQRYEAMCVLYVALTRAKRGLYVLLPEVPKSRKDADEWASMANWISRSGSQDGPVIFQSGDPAWWREVGHREVPVKDSVPALAAGFPLRDRVTPSGAKKEAPAGVASASGMAFGAEVHEGFERLSWVDEEPFEAAAGAGGALIAELLEISEIRAVFERGGRRVDLFREQPVESVAGKTWLSGVIDRLHLFRDEAGQVERIEVIDFKTDAVESADQLAGRYVGQMQAYRELMTGAFGDVPVKCLLLSTKLRAWVEV